MYAGRSGVSGVMALSCLSMSLRENLMTGKRRRLMLYPVIVSAGVGLSLAYALDSNGRNSDRDPFALFRTGVSAYKSEYTDEAVRALRYAAEMGHIWAPNGSLPLCMGKGDGVPENNLEAYHFFLKIVNDEIDPGS